MFVALEGIDGSGTTTLAHTLGQMLGSMGMECHLTHEPSDGRVGRLIRTLLSGEGANDGAMMALLFAADRVDHYRNEIAPALSRGEIVVSDRYVLSSLAYQGALGMDIGWLLTLNSRVPWPDLTVFLDIEPSVALQRISGREHREQYERLEFQERVLQLYRSLLDGVKGRLLVLDATLPPDTLAHRVAQAIMEGIRGAS